MDTLDGKTQNDLFFSAYDSDDINNDNKNSISKDL